MVDSGSRGDMKRIAYAEEWLTTDDRVADLVLEYARALARMDTADTVTIPVLEGHDVRHAQFLVGPASQIIVVSPTRSVPSSSRSIRRWPSSRRGSVASRHPTRCSTRATTTRP